MSVAERVKRLIDEYHGGNVVAAAKAAGVPQRSLYRLYDGAQNPRAELLQGVANHFGTSVEWLLTGKGSEPTGPARDTLLPFSQLQRWENLIFSLDLDLVAARAWSQVPSAIGQASLLLGSARTLRTPMMTKAMGHELWAWTMFLEEWIRVRGREKAREIMQAPDVIAYARLGFAWLPIVLYGHKERGPEFRDLMEQMLRAHGLDGSPVTMAPEEAYRRAGSSAAGASKTAKPRPRFTKR